MGKNALLRHAKSKIHKKAIQRRESTNEDIPSTSTADTSSSSFNDHPSLNEKIRYAEAMWCSIVAEHDISFLTSDHVSKNFARMFPDSAVAAGFKCCLTKTKYILSDGIAVNVQEKLTQSLQNVPFSLLVDESNKQYGKKFLSLMVKFHDLSLDEVTTRFLDIWVCNKGNSESITNHVVNTIRSNNLSFDNLIQVMTDNPNVMRGIHTGVVTTLRNEYASHLIDIGGCSLHHISNTIKNSLPELYQSNELDNYLQDVSAFFSFHVEFVDEFSEIQDIFDLENHRLLKYSEIRFLSIYIVVERVIEQHKAIEKLFLHKIPKYHKKVALQKRVIRIRNALKDKFTLPTQHFILHALEIFQRYEKLFQRSETTIHLLYDKQIELFQNTIMHFCPLDKIQNLKDTRSLLSFDYYKKENILSLEEISIGIEAKKFVVGFSENDKTIFYHGVKKFFISICDELKKNLPYTNKFLSNLRFLKPEYKTCEGEKMILKCVDKMPPVCKLNSREKDALSMEWKHLVLTDIPEIPKVNGHIPIDTYWKTILEMNDNGEPKFPNIKKVVNFSRSIAEANADVERHFSQVFHIIGKDRNSLATPNLRGLLIAKSYLDTIGCCLNFEIDQSMMANVIASHSKYVERTTSDENIKESCVHKRILNDAKETYKGNKKMRALEAQKVLIEEQEKVLINKQKQAKLLIEQANSLMEDTQKMSKFIGKEKEKLVNAEEKVKEAVLKSTCQKMIRKSLSSIDNNNNQVNGDNN